MNLKEFFKPTIWKIVLFVIMLVFLNPLSFYLIVQDCAGPNCCGIGMHYNLLGNDIQLKCGLSPYSDRTIRMFMLFSPILEYIIACAIMYLFSKKK